MKADEGFFFFSHPGGGRGRAPVAVRRLEGVRQVELRPRQRVPEASSTDTLHNELFHRIGVLPVRLLI